MCKKMVLNVLVLRQFHAPIIHQGVKPTGMSDDAWALADLSAKSIIELSLHESVVWNVDGEVTAWGVWKKLQDTYEQQNAATKIYWLHKFFNLKMKEGTSIDMHLNEFNSIVT